MSESKLLKVVSILMIIGAALALLLGLVGLFLGGALATGNAFGGGLLIVASVVSLIVAAFDLVVGVIGVKNWNNPSKAGTLLILGIVLVALSVISIILTIVFSAGNINASGLVMNVVSSLVLPVLYVVGANQLKGGAK